MSPVKTAGKTGAAPAQIRIADQNPLEFTGGGLPTDFDGTIIEARSVLWNYDNGKGPKVDDKSGEVIIAPFMKLTIAREGEENVVSFYSAGDKGNFWPVTEEGVLAEQDETGCAEGVMFGLVGVRDKMGKETNHGHFMTALIDAKFPAEKVKADLRFLEGASGHFDRMPAKKRSGIVVSQEQDPNGSNRAPEILLMTAFKGYGAVTATVAPTTKTAAKPTASVSPVQAKTSAPSNGSVAVSEKLRELIAANLPDEGGTKQGSFAQLVMKATNFTPAERSTAVKTISSEWLEAWANEEGAGIIYDPAAKEVYKNVVE